MDNIETDFEQPRTSHPGWDLPLFAGRVIGKTTAIVWRWGHDRQAVAAFLGRYSAHLAILTLALLVGVLGHVALFPPAGAETASSQEGFMLSVAAEPVATSTPQISVEMRALSTEYFVPRAVVRQAQPHTEIPERVRLSVITYTVEPGDNIFFIAKKFGLDYTSVVWSNMEPLQGAPWDIAPGLPLYIPPVDGAYHTVMEGDSLASIAETYDVPVSTLFNQWNELEEGQELQAGMLLFIPDGIGEEFLLAAPTPTPAPYNPAAPAVGVASGSYGACGDTAVAGPGARGWFILPTGSYEVSGWVFGDPRNPRHIGLDYRCRLGDPIYAADNGVVVYAGWRGGYGNFVQVRHGNGYDTYYAHFSAYAVGCGDPVVAGQVIGYCGSTGWSTGPHLHYEIRYNGVPQNPRLYEP